MGPRPFDAEIYGLERGLAQYKIQQRSIVCLYHEEEDLLKWNVTQFWADYDMARIGPDAGADEVRVPWYRGNDCDLWP